MQPDSRTSLGSCKSWLSKAGGLKSSDQSGKSEGGRVLSDFSIAG